jgi:phosphate/sulfate permease
MDPKEEILWNSLEIWKLIISGLTPIIGGIIAYLLFKLGKNSEKKQWTNRKVIEKRLDFYDNVASDLNDLYCYYHRVGNWKELTPTQIIEKKRLLDKEFRIYSHIFKQDILVNYRTFIEDCFKTFTGTGNDAKIKMSLTKRVNLPNWDNEWNELFVESEMVSEERFEQSYKQMLHIIKTELGIE